MDLKQFPSCPRAGNFFSEASDSKCNLWVIWFLLRYFDFAIAENSHTQYVNK